MPKQSRKKEKKNTSNKANESSSSRNTNEDVTTIIELSSSESADNNWEDGNGSTPKQTKLNPNARSFELNKNVRNEPDDMNWSNVRSNRGGKTKLSDASLEKQAAVVEKDDRIVTRNNSEANWRTDNKSYEQKTNYFDRNRSPAAGKNRRSNVLDWDEEKEYKTYRREMYERDRNDENFEKVTEIFADLFTMEEDYSLAHCVAEDMNMGSGIAVQFRLQFRRLGDLLNQKQSPGGMAALKEKDRFVYYLVTKRYSHGKPTYETLFSSLLRLREHIIKNNVKKLAVPRIGCGLDRLEWDDVKFMLEFLFKNVDVEITVCNLQVDAPSPQSKPSTCKIVHETYPIENIEVGTLIIFLCSEDGHLFEEIKNLDAKFHFLNDFRSTRRSLGNLYTHSRNDDYILCGCYVKKSKDSEIDFAAFQDCLHKINPLLRKKKFEYVGVQAIKDKNPCTNQKVINLLRNILRGVDIYVCWPGDLTNEMPTMYKENTSFNQSWNSASENSKEKTPQKEDSIWSPKASEKSDLSQASTSQDYWEAVPETKKEISTKDNFISKPEIKEKKKNVVRTNSFVGKTEKSNSRKITFKEYKIFKEKKIDLTSVENSKDYIMRCPKEHHLMFFITETMNTDQQNELYYGENFHKHIKEITKQRKKEGDVAVVEHDSQIYYYLVVKGDDWDVIKEQTFFSCAKKLVELCIKRGTKHLGGPKLRESPELINMLEFCFRGHDIRVSLYNFKKMK